MDPRERFDDPEEALRVAMEGMRSGLWTAMPGIIQSFSASAVTATVQMAIKGIVQDQAGKSQFVNLPLLVDVPVFFPRGGNCTLTFPVAKNDECLVVFASRCVDGWFQSGGIQAPLQPRMHSMSDGFALVGFFSQATKISGISTSTAQLRSNDGSTYIDLNPSAQTVKVVAPGGFEVDSPTITLNGQLAQGNGATKYPATLQGPITVVNDLTAAGKSVSTHTHHENGAGSNTNPPN